jgi:hypothetical protein
MTKKFFLWILVILVVFSILTIATHFFLTINPKKIVIAIDTSLKMKDKSYDIVKKLGDILDSRYAEFIIISDKSKILSTKEKVDVSGYLRFYGPSDIASFADLTKNPVLKNSDKIIFIVNSDDKEGLDKLKSKFFGAQFITF